MMKIPQPFNFKQRPMTLPSGELTIQQLQDTLSGLRNGKAVGKFKPRRLTPQERSVLRTIGLRREIAFDQRPDYELKTVTDDQCDLCGQPLPNLAICTRCGNCVFCGGKSPDPHSQNCNTCGNHVPGRSDDTDAILIMGI